MLIVLVTIKKICQNIISKRKIMQRTAVIIGATGLVGQALLLQLPVFINMSSLSLAVSQKV